MQREIHTGFSQADIVEMKVQDERERRVSEQLLLTFHYRLTPGNLLCPIVHNNTG